MYQIPDNVNVLDLAVKFCLQNKSAEKPKPLPVFTSLNPPIPRSPGIASVGLYIEIICSILG